MGFSPLANKTTDTFQKSSRNGQPVGFFGVHHAASTSHQAVVNMMTSGSREVSAHYVVSDIIEGVVDEDYRAWSLSSPYWDSRMVVAETINNSTNGWTVSDKTFDNLARLIADWSDRYGIPITDDTVLTHQEVYTRFGQSYPTACPGDLQRRKPELLALANQYKSTGFGTIPEKEDEDMDSMFAIVDGVPSWCFLNWSNGRIYAVHTQAEADWIGAYMGSVKMDLSKAVYNGQAVTDGGSNLYKSKLALFGQMTSSPTVVNAGSLSDADLKRIREQLDAGLKALTLKVV